MRGDALTRRQLLLAAAAGAGMALRGGAPPRTPPTAPRR
jgi:hypothetical protein